jgi:phage tail-like protein
MPDFSVNSLRIDPYKNFKFNVLFDGKVVAAVAKCGGLKKTTEVEEWREAGNSFTVKKLPKRTSFQPIVLEAGVTHDTAFEDWASLVNAYTGGTDDTAKSALSKFRRNIRIELLNEQGTTVLAYDIARAWVSEYQALPDLDAGAHAVAITSIKIEHEGFTRDLSVTEPMET